MVYSFGMEGERKKKSQSPWLYSSQYSISIMWMERTQKSSFWALYLSLWLLEKTSVVQMWDGKSGLHWHRPCGCFGAGAHSAVGYRCLLSSINVASMWNHGIRSATQRSTPLIVWEITPSWRNSFLKGWNTFLNIRSFPFRGVEPGKRGLMTLDWAPGTVSSGGYSLGTLNWKLKKKKKVPLLSLRFVSPKFYAVHVAESLVHASHWMVSLEMPDGKLEWWWLSLGLTRGEMFPPILISLSCH